MENANNWIKINILIYTIPKATHNVLMLKQLIIYLNLYYINKTKNAANDSIYVNCPFNLLYLFAMY